MKEIQEKRIESELSALQSNQFFSKISKKVSYEEMMIDLKYLFDKQTNKVLTETEGDITGKTESLEEVVFSIHILPNFPFSSPRVYCKSAFVYPSIADGRDILDEIINQQWSVNIKLELIVNSIPSFLEGFMNNLSKGKIFLSGNYLLEEKYDLSLFEDLPVYIQKVKEVISINNKDKEFQRVMIITDMFFLLFEPEKWNIKNNFMKLTFWSNIKALVLIKKNLNNEICRFFWKQKSKRVDFELRLLINTDSSTVVDLLLSKMKNFGINYKVSRLCNTPKEGSIPSIDIESVEESILDEERKIESRCSPVNVHVEYLIDLYSKAIDYYSATNNSRYITIKKKMQEMLKNENFSSEDRKKEIDIEINPEKEEENKENKENKEDFEKGININKDEDKEILDKTEEVLSQTQTETETETKTKIIEKSIELDNEVKELKEDDKTIIKVYEDDEEEEN